MAEDYGENSNQNKFHPAPIQHQQPQEEEKNEKHSNMVAIFQNFWFLIFSKGKSTWILGQDLLSSSIFHNPGI